MNKLNTDTQLPQTIVMPSAYILSEQISLYGEPDCICLLYTSPSPRDRQKSRMPSSA